jgi:molybdopterin-guanine dinucleotide biosynthesis protein A
MIEDCTALVIAGGESRRMGCDKARLLLGDQTLLQRVILVMQQVFPRVLVSVREHRPEINLAQIRDAPAHAGPLAGLCAGLAQSRDGWVFAIATDMPFIQPALIERLAQRRADCQAVVPVVHGHPQALAAFYSASGLPIIQGILSGTGKRSLRAALLQLKVHYVAESELPAAELRSFIDLDTPQDVARARQSEESV